MRTVQRGMLAAFVVASASCSLSIDPESVKAPGPNIVLSASTLTFTATQGATQPTPQTITVGNTGAGVLATPVMTISYTTGTGWLGGSVTGGAAPYTVSLQPSTTGLAPGAYVATVSLACAGAANTPQAITVTYQVGSPTQPTIALSQPSLTFSAIQSGSSPAAQTISVSNSGTGTLAAPTTSIAYATTPGWLTATVSGGAAPYTITVQPTAGSLAAGIYSASVSVVSPGASNTPQTFAVTFTISAPPTMLLSSSSLGFSAVAGGASPASQSVTVSNTGGGTLASPTTSISYGSGSGWLAAAVSGAAAPFTITLTPTVGSLPAGTYTATVSVASAGASNTPRSITVTFTVDPAALPTIALSTATLSFSATEGAASPAPQSVTVSNSGTGSLAVPTTSIAYGAGTGWLAASVSGASAPYTVSVQPMLGSLAAGTYTATISVAAGGASNTPQTIAVTFTVGSTTQPTIALSAASLSFSAIQGGTSPSAQTVSVTNSGTGTLAAPTTTIAYGSGSGWLTAAVSGAGVPYTITVQASLGALAPGTYGATISVASAAASNTPQAISVTFVVAAQSAIALSSSTLTFATSQGGASPAAQTVSVTNSGGSTLAIPVATVAYGTGSGWLTASVAGASAPYTITVQPTLGALAAGTYTATVSVACAGASNSPRSISVTLNVAGQPTIALSAASLTFSATQGGSSPAAQAVTASNSGGGTLALPTTTISYSSGSGWLTATVSGASAPYTVTVQPALGGLAPGTYGATVSVESAGATNTPQAIGVSFTVNSSAQPTIALSSSSLTFTAIASGASPAAQNVTVTNAGTGALAIPTATITYGAGTGWLSATVSGASAPYTVAVQPTTGALTTGTYTATILIASPGATNTPQPVIVTFTVTQQPTIALSSSSLTFTATQGSTSPPAQTASVTNTGGGTLATPTATIAYGAGTGWLTATVTGSGSPYTITVQPTVSSLAAGTYVATILVASVGASNTPQPLIVTFTVAPQPAIALSASSLTFSAAQGGASPGPQTVSVTNASAGILATPTTSITYGSGAGWLTANVSGAAAPFTVTVQPSVTGLTAGTYTATILVASAGASNTPQPVTVTFSVGSPAVPTIALSTTSLGFSGTVGGAPPASQAVSVSNSGTGTLAAPTTTVSYGSGSGWLSATVSGATAPFTLTVQPTSAGLVAGTYIATIAVSSAGASNTPQSIGVSFQVMGMGGCVVASGGHQACGLAASGGGAERVSTVGGHAVRRSQIQGGGGPTVQSTDHKIARGSVSPGAAKP